jgi:hypothetical protein
MTRFSPQLLRNLQQNNLKPTFVVEIEGIDFKITSETIFRTPRYGDPDLFYGREGLVYGGLIPFEDNDFKALISATGTTRQITQNLDIDKAAGSTASTFSLELTDINGEATKIGTGFYNDEILYKDVVVWIGFNTETSVFNLDYVVLFRGTIESVDFLPASVRLNLASVDVKRRQSVGLIGTGELNDQILTATSSPDIRLKDNFNPFFRTPSSLRGVDFTTQDPAMKTYVRINDEIIRYNEVGFFDGGAKTSLQITTRAQIGTVAATHDEDSEVSAFYVLEDHALNLALKIMLSKADEENVFLPYIDRLQASSVNFLPEGGPVQNAIYFPGVNLLRDFNVSRGDFLDLRQFNNAQNNTVDSFDTPGFRPIVEDVFFIGQGSYIVVDNIIPEDPVPNNFFNLVSESSTEGKVSFYSKYNSFGKAFGLGLNPNEVDIAKFEFIRDSFLLQADVRFFIRDEIENAREWINEQLLLPFGCYSIPSDAEGLGRISINISLPPLPIDQIQTLSVNNIVNPERLQVKRSVNRYYYAGVIYRFEDSPLDEELRRRAIVLVGSELIPSSDVDLDTGSRNLIIEAQGLRQEFGANTLALIASRRILNRYKGAAELIPNVQVLFSVGGLINIGDRVILDAEGLNLVNRETFRRDRQPMLMEVVNRQVNPFTGQVTVDLLDTSFGIDNRYGLISPSSKISRALDLRRIVIDPSFGARFGTSEFRKWETYIGARVKVRSLDWSDVFETSLVAITGNTLTLSDDIPFLIGSNYLLEMSDYLTQDLDKVRLIYAHLNPNIDDDFDNDDAPYLLI